MFSFIFILFSIFELLKILDKLNVEVDQTIIIFSSNEHLLKGFKAK